MTKTLTEIAEKMKDIDFAMLTTRTEGGALSARPMSNNRDVEFDGDSWFFGEESVRWVRDVEADPQVGLTMQAKGGLLGKPGMFIGIEGRAELIRDKAQFAAHWTKDLERWWPDGIDTAGIVLVKVHAERVHYWDGEDQGEVVVAGVGAGFDIEQNVGQTAAMQTVTYSEARDNLKAVMDKAITDRAPIMITRQRGENVIVVSADEWAGMEETLYLMSSLANAKHLMKGIAQLDAGKGKEYELIKP